MTVAGMFDAMRVFGRAFSLWWHEVLMLTVLNVAWLALQVPVVTGPPATAAMAAMARRVADGEPIGPREAWRALRQMFWPAWGWGLLNGLIFIVVVSNFAAYGSAPGLLWAILRIAWGTIAALWFALNLFYWPFWLAQSDRRLVTTLHNAALLLLKSPGLGLTLLLLCAMLIVVSIGVTLPLAVALSAWLALIGVLAVDVALKRPGYVQAEPDIELEPL
jgi:uncharacterized membrane protein YesL